MKDENAFELTNYCEGLWTILIQNQNNTRTNEEHAQYYDALKERKELGQVSTCLFQIQEL